MARLFQIGSAAVFTVATVALMLLAVAFIGFALIEVARQAVSGESVIPAMLNAVGLIIIALAVFDVAKFLFEEEIQRDKELRSPREARQTLTKFLTIVIIAVSLEALVFVFEAGKENITNV